MSRARVARSLELISDSNRLVSRALPGFGIPVEPLSDEDLARVVSARAATLEQLEIEREVRNTAGLPLPRAPR